MHLAGFLCALLIGLSARSKDWQQAAGPNGNFTTHGSAPAEFSVTQGKNVIWRTKLPSTGQGTAIVSHGRVFVTSHAPITEDSQYGSNILGMCFDAKTGKELWRRNIPGTRNTDLSSLFSDNTAASPIADGERVCFVNVGGAIRCFDFEGGPKWNYDWTPFGRHHARLHEPILHDGAVITVQYPHQDLEFIHTTKSGAKPLGRDRKYWTHLQAFDLKTGKRRWISAAGTSIHETSLIGKTEDGTPAILTGRGGGHKPPEEPYGMSLVNVDNGSTIWESAIDKYPAAQNACWNDRHAFGFAGREHVTVDIKTGKVIRRVSLVEGVTITSRDGDKYITRKNAKLAPFKRPITKNTNVLIDRHDYFRASEAFMIGRVNIETGEIEYLEVPVQVVRRPGARDEIRWTDALKNDMKNAGGFLATQDKRNAGNGWGHVSAASGTVVGDKIYFPTMIGMVYVLDWNAKRLDEKALLSISDLGPATETWSLSGLSFADGRIYARTLKELICIGEAN